MGGDAGVREFVDNLDSSHMPFLSVTQLVLLFCLDYASHHLVRNPTNELNIEVLITS